MNWKFQDIVNLKMNVQKLYKGINKSIKMQKEVLETKFKESIIVHQRNLMLFPNVENGIGNIRNAVEFKEATKETTEKKVISKKSYESLK